MNNLLYYPYINLPNTDWAIRALLYYDNISSIVPTQYFYEPEQYEPFMREVIQNELIHPINPMRLCQNADTAFFYAQSPDFLKPGLCYYPKFSYL